MRNADPMSLSDPLEPPTARGLLMVAAPSEGRAISAAFNAKMPDREWSVAELDHRWDLVLTGIGKANAAGAAGHAVKPGAHGLVLSIGVAGSLPGCSLELTSSVAATACVFGDEGLVTPKGFQACDEMGFPLGDFAGSAVPVDERVVAWLGAMASTRGLVATVSTCSGTDDQAATIRQRTGAIAEGMEGAAVGLVCRRMGVPFGEVRVISNTTGNRESQIWDLPGALTALTRLASKLRDAAPPRL
jgi:futalosine hydrolase